MASGAAALSASPSALASSTELVSLLVVLTELAMLRALLARTQVRLYCLQSAGLAALAATAAATQHVGELWALVGLTVALKVLAVPWLLSRTLLHTDSSAGAHRRLDPAATLPAVVACALAGLLLARHLPLRPASFPPFALGLATVVVLVAFLIAIVHSDMVSQAVAFFSLENGVSMLGLAVADRLPLLVEVGLAFDLLVAVVALAVVMRVHHRRTRTLSADLLARLRG
ncbi:MAG TPA: hypothetical protein VKY15_02495 [Acidimicrobiales bacterium]|nr:hypothetical protein [Acidimicrobiales bacterium]